jgi:serine/threonine-protein kinase
VLSPGTQVERYEVLDLLGEGGLARVYRVRHTQLGTIHALKLLTLKRDGLAARLLLEGRIQAQLRHPNIVVVSDVVQYEGQPGLIIEYVEGPTLDDWLRTHGPPSVDECLRLFAGVLAAVRAAHASGVLHRDLKPANVLMQGKRPVAKVADFGIAKVAQGAEVAPAPRGQTRAGVAMGTPGYMAPEQFNDAAGVDARADIFALGTILYELLTGHPAFSGDTLLDTLNAVAEGRYRPLPELNPDVPPHVAAAVARAVIANADRRFPDCDAFAVALYVDRQDLLELVQSAEPGAPVGLMSPASSSSPARPWISSTSPGPTGTKDALNATMIASPVTMQPELFEEDGPAPTATLPPSRPVRNRRPLYALATAGLMSAFGLLLATTVGGVWALKDDRAPTEELAMADAPSRANVAEPRAASPASALDAQVASSEPARSSPVPESGGGPTAPAEPIGVPPQSAGAAPERPVEVAATAAAASTSPAASSAASTSPAPSPAPASPAAPAALTDAPAVASVEPPPAAAATPASIRGTWSGRWNGRPLTLRIDRQSGTDVRARVEVLLGTTPRAWTAAGTFDGSRLSLTGDDGFVMSGTLSGSEFTGTVAATGQKSAAWDARL